MRKGYVLLRSAAGSGREGALARGPPPQLDNVELLSAGAVARQVAATTVGAHFRSLDCVARDDARDARHTFEREYGHRVFRQRSNGDYTQSLTWRAHALIWS